MALQLSPSVSSPFLARPSVQYRVLAPTSVANVAWRFKCLAATKTEEATVERRTANFRPNIWDYDFVLSLRSDYHDESHGTKTEKLKDDIRRLIRNTTDPLSGLELIDAVQRLGVGYLFEKEINEALKTISVGGTEGSLHGTALCFRLLRQHGYEVTQDVFNGFKDESGGFNAGLSEDIKGLLSLYEACFVAVEGETLLDEAKAFASTNLKALKGNADVVLNKKVEHALELPLHLRMPRLEARWYLGVYESEENMNPTLLKLAKLDYNMVQAIHQRDLRSASRWWLSLGLSEKLSFARDRLVESFVVGLGVVFEPQYGHSRIAVGKSFQLITTIDDIYDVYGKLDELELFTEAVERWDIQSMERLPAYMKVCFLALYNTTNEMGYEIVKEQGCNIIPYLQREWLRFCKAMLVEAKWFHSGYKPTLEEYINNAWQTSSAPVMLVHALLLSGQKITKEILDSLDDNPKLVRWPSVIFRLYNDLASDEHEQERGDVSSAIQCHMHQANVPERVARNHIKKLALDTWKKLNEELDSRTALPFHFTNFAVNLARVAHCIYGDGDTHSNPDAETKERITSLLVKPISIEI